MFILTCNIDRTKKTTTNSCQTFLIYLIYIYTLGYKIKSLTLLKQIKFIFPGPQSTIYLVCLCRNTRLRRWCTPPLRRTAAAESSNRRHLSSRNCTNRRTMPSKCERSWLVLFSLLCVRGLHHVVL